jgi:hypothetical protein
MGEAGLVILAFALPTAAMYAIIVTLRGGRILARRRYQPPPPEPMQRLTSQLRRLRAELEETEGLPHGTAKNHHVRTLRGAYLDALAEACSRLGVPPPAGGDRARQAEIYRVEAALRARGLDVREAAAP